MKNILIAGGTGMIGKQLSKRLIELGYEVKLLSRNPKDNHEVRWSPTLKTIDRDKVANTEVLINLCGEGIDKGRWTKKRKQILESSRIGTNEALFEMKDAFPNLKHFISASGITCYGFDDGSVFHSETDEFGKNYISQLVKKWEQSADLFKDAALVSKIRIAMVLDKEEGAIHRLAAPIKWGIGSPIGTGKQFTSWIHLDDLVALIIWVVEHQLEGTYNANANDDTNETFVHEIAKTLKKPLWMPRIPSFSVELLFGELSEILLQGTRVSNDKIKATGFTFKYPTLDKALKSVYEKGK